MSKNNAKEEWQACYEDLASKVEHLSVRVSTSDIRNNPRSADQHEDRSDFRTVQDTNTARLAADVDLLKKGYDVT